jgi:hypothetical protein
MSSEKEKLAEEGLQAKRSLENFSQIKTSCNDLEQRNTDLRR